MEHLLLIFLTTIGLATVVNLLLRRFGLPTILGYIFSGVVIRYLFQLQNDIHQSLNEVAEFGIVFLMFTIGLEFSITHLKSMKKEVFLYGSMQVLLSGLLFSVLSYFIAGLELKSAIVIGFALSLSSTAIVLKILNENAQIHTQFGRISVGILIFQDLAVIPILLMISIFSDANQALLPLLLKTSISAVIVFFIIFVAGRYTIEKILGLILRADSEEIFLIAILSVVVGASVVAELFGFSFSLGAFLAGMTIAETKYRYRVEADLTPFRDILLGIFFISIGLQIDLITAWENLSSIAAVVLIIMSLKALVIYGFLRLFIQSRTAIKSALTLFQIGEFALAIFALARTNALIDIQTNQILIMSVVISMIIAPFMLKNIKRVADFFSKEPIIEQENLHSTGYQDHLIICGYGDLGKSLAKKFKKMGLFYIILEHDITLVEEGEKAGEPILLANAAQKSVLEAVNIDKSLAVMVAISNTKKLRLICENIASFDSDINSVVMVKNDSHEAIIRDLKINHIVNQSREMAKALMNEAVKCKIG